MGDQMKKMLQFNSIRLNGIGHLQNGNEKKEDVANFPYVKVTCVSFN